MIVILELVSNVPEVFQHRVKPGRKRFAHVKTNGRRSSEERARIFHGIKNARLHCGDRGKMVAAEQSRKLTKYCSRLRRGKEERVILSDFDGALNEKVQKSSTFSFLDNSPPVLSRRTSQSVSRSSVEDIR